MSRRTGLLALAGFFLLISGILFWLARKKNLELPDKEISSARISILEAKKHGADIHSGAQYESAVFYYDSAIRAWSHENDRIIFFREYEKIKYLAHVADSLAKQSSALSTGVLDDAQSTFRHQYELISEKVGMLKNINSKFRIPDQLSSEIRNLQVDFAQLTLHLQEGEWVEGEKKSTSMLLQSNLLLNRSQEFIDNYFLQFDAWQTMAGEGIIKSGKKKAYLIIVDKLAEELHLFHAGKQIKSFSAEFGQNWIGDKNYEGDKSTPEGTYHILNKKQDQKTKYYKAMGINYPNELDKKRFSENKKKGAIASSKRIGGLIEIHGDGGKGYHWTDGCIALKNEDMDILYKMVPVNTEVVIVGSLRPLEEIIEL